MKIKNKRFTPERVESLSQCEIFVFGSNLEGQHMGGAATRNLEQNGVLATGLQVNAMLSPRCTAV